MKIYKFFFKVISLIPIAWFAIFILFILSVIITFGEIPEGFRKTEFLIYLSWIEGLLFFLSMYSIVLWPMLFIIGLIVKKMNIPIGYKAIYVIGLILFMLTCFWKGSFFNLVAEHWL